MNTLLKPLINELQKRSEIFAPQKTEEGFAIEKLENPENFEFTAQQPLFSFKKFFVPERETLIEYAGTKQREARDENKNISLLGLNILDLKYVLLYDLVFAKDTNYQKRRQNIFIVAHNLAPDKENNFTERKFDEEVLRDYPYDIFVILDHKTQPGLTAGSKKGREILEYLGLEHRDLSWRQIKKPALLPPHPEKIRQKLMAQKNEKLWEELNERCLRCGKCTMVCPTCFCFRIDDKPALGGQTGERQRCWDSCFFDEFHEVTGGHDFHPAIKNRIFFWYFHKFARIPKEFNLTGCVGCKRCFKVCPANIDIEKVLDAILYE